MQYSARVEIHNNDYDGLHAAMALESFERILTAEGTGVRYHMPIGHYWIETNNDKWSVLGAAKRAALTVDPNAEIVVSGDGRIAFYGCQKIGQPALLPIPLAPRKPGSLAYALAGRAMGRRSLSGRL
jgi:hypothetical protein